MIIQYYSKHVYGIVKHYVADTAVASAIMTLTDRKTIDKSDMTALEALGFTLEEIIEPKK